MKQSGGYDREKNACLERISTSWINVQGKGRTNEKEKEREGRSRRMRASG